MNFRACSILFILLCSSVVAQPFKIISYNILDDNFLSHGDYSYVPEHILAWENRKNALCNRIIKLNADVICLQELNYESYMLFQMALQEYIGCYAQKASQNSGIGTFCRKSTFKEINHTPHLCPGTSHCGKLASQPAVFTTLVLPDQKKVQVIHTKIKWTKEFEIPTSSYNHVNYILEQKPEFSCIIAGDFNVTQEHPLMKLFLKSNFFDPFSGSNITTCYANEETKRIDYILLSKDLITLDVTIDTIKSPIPNENEPSDHIPIGCTICHV